MPGTVLVNKAMTKIDKGPVAIGAYILMRKVSKQNKSVEYGKSDIIKSSGYGKNGEGGRGRGCCL